LLESAWLVCFWRVCVYFSFVGCLHVYENILNAVYRSKYLHPFRRINTPFGGFMNSYPVEHENTNLSNDVGAQTNNAGASFLKTASLFILSALIFFGLVVGKCALL
jgi:hypothetical protein